MFTMKFSFSLLIAVVLAILPVKLPAVLQESRIVYDENTGVIISEQNADARVFPSSMTKMVTLLVAFEKIARGEVTLDDEFVVSNSAWKMKGTSMFLKQGQSVSVRDLLTGIITVSGNDASIALAEGISGSEENFVADMNRCGKKLKLKNSHFMNPSGWPQDDHYMSLRDILIVAREIFNKYPQYHSMFTMKEFTFNDVTQPNTNQLLNSGIGVDGIKTGATNKGGHGIAATAYQNGRRVFLVNNGFETSRTRFDDAIRSFRAAFSQYVEKKIYSKGDLIASIEVPNGNVKNVKIIAPDDILVLVDNDSTDSVEVELQTTTLVAPLKKGHKIGELTIFSMLETGRRKVHKVVPLYIPEDIGEISSVRKMFRKIFMIS